MSLRNKQHVRKTPTTAELDHLKAMNNRQAQAEMEGLTPEQASKMAEERVFFKKGDAKGKVLVGGETAFVKIAPDGTDGTQTFIEYEDKNNIKRQAKTRITSNKKLVDANNQVIRELY